MEKLGVLKAVDQVIRVDEMVYEGEVFFISQLSKVITFDRGLFDQAREIEFDEAMMILKNMPDYKKEALAMILNQAANSDGSVGDEELRTIRRIFKATGVDFQKF